MADDEEWVRRARKRDAEAWRVLYATHASVVRRVCSAFVSLSGADVEDVVQETFVRAFRGIDGLRDDAAYRPWILSIARTACLKRIARAQADLQGTASYLADPSVGPTLFEDKAAEIGCERRIELVRAMIDNLPAGEQRETIRSRPTPTRSIRCWDVKATCSW